MLNNFKGVKKFRDINFNFSEVIVIVIITIICVTTLNIKISYSVNNTSKKIKTRSELAELINTYDSIIDEYYTDVDKTELIDSAIQGMIDVLDDPYSVFINSAQEERFNQNLEGTYVGIGTEIVMTDDNKVVIRKVFENSPAYSVGIKEDDIIVKIDDVNVADKSINDISSLMKGDEGTGFSLTIKRNNSEKKFDLVRKKIEIQSAYYRLIELNDKKVAIVNITSFAGNTYEQFAKIAKDIKSDNVNGVILDLRGNTGGYLLAAYKIAGLFLNKGDVVYQLDTKGVVEKKINESEPIFSFKPVILVNKTTASASEVLAASLNENLGSPIVGVTTYGKGKVQKMKTLSSGAMIKYTVQNWLTPLGSEIDGKGIIPTFEISLDEKYLDNPIDKNDNQLKKALELICK